MSTLNNESTPLICLQPNEESQPVRLSDSSTDQAKTSFIQSVLNIAKICIGSGSLGLPFGASQGGILFNVIGLFIITVWNIFMVNRLLKTLDYIQQHNIRSCICGDDKRNGSNERFIKNSPMLIPTGKDICNDNNILKGNEILDNSSIDRMNMVNVDEPQSSDTFAKVAWYAFGSKGLHTIDAIMITLMIGIIVSYEDAAITFIEQTSLTTGSKGYDAVLVFSVIMPFACISEYQSVAKFSAFGLFLIIGVFVVVVNYGIHTNGLHGFNQITTDNLWPKSLSSFSNWFGAVVFSYGIVPFTFNLQESMADPAQMPRATKMACTAVFIIYFIIGDIVAIIFLPSNHNFGGDVLSVLPNTWISTFIRLAMTSVMVTSIPLILIPTGDLLLRKIGMRSDHKYASRISLTLRVSMCCIGAIISATLPNFVYVMSFLGCLCVSLMSFVYPLVVHLVCFYKFCPEDVLKANSKHVLLDGVLLLFGTGATILTSYLTYRTLMSQL